jgi:hypothetical protein
MLKRVELWIVLITLLIFTIGAVIFGGLVRHELLASESKFPKLTKAALFIAEIPSNANRMVNGINSDMRVEDRFPNVSGFEGKPNNYESYLLLSRYSGEKNESIVELIDLTSFNKIHEWNPDIDKSNSIIEAGREEFQYLARDKNNSRYSISHPLLFDDGSIIFHGGSTALTRVDQCSNLIWQNDEDRFHHSIEVDYEGDIYVPIHIYPYEVDQKYVGDSVENFLDDGIAKISKQGKMLYKKSIANIFLENDLGHLLFGTGDDEFNRDPIHLNDIQPLLKDTLYGKKGDLFLSMRHQSMLILYRPSSNKIIWRSTGKFLRQHDVDILDDRTISIFNNDSPFGFSGAFVDGHNEVLIYDFNDSKTSKYLDGSLSSHDLKTVSGGRSQIIDNGDLFVEETNFGRSVYFDADGSLRWQHVNRAEDGVYSVNWSRIIYEDRDVSKVKGFLENRKNCN